MTQPHSLTWGLQLAGPTDPDTDFLIEVMADGTNFGNPEALFERIRSLLTDGSLVVSDGFDNREVPIRLRLSAPTGAAGPILAAAEAALMAQCVAEVKPPIVYVPPATDSATCVYDVVGADLMRDTSDGWDFEEVRREYRYFGLTLDCLPFVRGEETVIVPALTPVPPTPTVVVIDACTSTSGWTGAIEASGTGLTVTSTGGYVQVAATASGSSRYFIRAARAGAVSMGTTPYLRITADSTNAPEVPTLNLLVPSDLGVGYAPIATAPSAIAGATDYFYLPPSSFSSFEFTLQGTGYPAGTAVSLRIHEVARTDTVPGSGTARQQSRTATVGGSAPTQAAIRLYDATPAALGGEALVYSTRNITFIPALRPFRVSSAAVTADTARVSGGRNTLTSSMVFRIPASVLSTGNHALMGMLNVTTSGTLTWSARMVDAAGATTLGSDVVLTGSTVVPVTGGVYQVLNLGRIPLPIVDIEADQMVELTITGTANMTVDEMWLFNVTDGALTWVRNSTVQWLDIRSPELAAARPSVYGGTGAFGANSVCLDWACSSFGVHRFAPGLMQIFTVTSSSLVSQSEIEYYERDHSHRTGEAA